MKVGSSYTHTHTHIYTAPPSLAPEPGDLENPYLPIVESTALVEAVMSEADKNPSSPLREAQPQSNTSKPPVVDENDYVVGLLVHTWRNGTLFHLPSSFAVHCS